jgi:hypothetical protein
MKDTDRLFKTVVIAIIVVGLSVALSVLPAIISIAIIALCVGWLITGASENE